MNHGFDSWTGIPWSHDFCPCPHNLTHTDDPQLCRPQEPGCPLYSNLEVFEQPAILDTLTVRYAKSAIKFTVDKEALEAADAFGATKRHTRRGHRCTGICKLRVCPDETKLFLHGPPDPPIQCWE